MVERRTSNRKRKAPERFAPAVNGDETVLPEDLAPLVPLEIPEEGLVTRRVTVSRFSYFSYSDVVVLVK